MKRVFLIISALILLLSVFNSCKKGEDDPFLSLRTRTQRLTGTWTLKSADYTKTEKMGSWYTAKYHYIYDGSKYNKEISYNDTLNNVETYNYSEEIEFKKNGTYSKNYSNNGDNFTEEGMWTWIMKNKESELKDKEAILITITKEIDTSGTETYSGVSNYPDDMMVFKKLSNKEFVIHFDYSHSNEDGEIASYTGTMTYTQD